MTEMLPCLIRVGENVKKYKLFILDKDEVTVGRSPDVTYCILSGMISRCHAFFRKSPDNTWTVSDNKSLNGIFVNDKRIEVDKAVSLNDGDKLQLGVTNKEKKEEFIFRFSLSSRVKRSRKESEESNRPNHKRSRQDSIDGIKLTQKSPECDNHVSSSQPDLESSSVNSPYKLYEQKMEEYKKQEEEKRKEYEEKLQSMKKMLEAKEFEQNEMRKALEKQKEEKLESEAKLKSALELQQEEMEREKTELKQQMQDELEKQLKNKEQSLIEQLRVQQDTLISEKAKVEESLKQEMEKAIEQKNKQLENELTLQRDKLQKVIDSKELEQKVLENQLEETKAENIKTKEAMLCARGDVLNNFKDLMETELQCSICSELFVQSTSLNCSHSFCALCIEQWMAVKKECPICRSPITSHMRSIVLDSYIDKMVEQLDDELRQSRKELVDGRKEEYKKLQEKKKAEVPGGSGAGRGRGGRARRRGGGSSGGNLNATPTTPSRRPIIISDEEEAGEVTDSDISNSSDNDSSDVEGDPDAYYGGYGRCYTCGRSGHWANGCPDNW
ncbi:hypothetical protein LOTGIDRAFT_232629 [Lottia gigantea]|uniref:E3 ubiquitin-protein ligase CHFR n=1 Tax=Lottia gigantea TaxID=225164 RepID=V4AJ63_LOTGI|nr:hypothetical protein LOTGIDRAFT_232629 [Lottia gigantea]ESO93576.1 hypothetical protein LOTGIDRAFT_232629 [Lottia gigantea]